MLSTNYADSMNLFWNQQLEASRANFLNCMVPAFNPSVFWEFPQYNMFGNSLLDPMLAVQQTIQSFQNNTWMNGGFNFNPSGINNFMPFNWNNPFTPSTPSADGAGGAKTDEEKAAQKTMQERYNKLKAVLTQYQKIANERKLGTDESRNKLSVAISKTGKLEERYKALQEAYKSIDSADLRKAFLSKPEILKDLNAIGYNFTDRTYHYGNKDKEDAALMSALDKLEQEITQKGSDKDNKQVTSNMVDRVQLYKSDNIMRTISYWNDTHNTDKDRSIVRLMINNLPSKTSDKAAYISNNIQPLSDALTGHANATIDELKSLNVDTTELEKQSKKVKDYFNTKSFASIELKAFADDFDKLYAMLRKADALKINKKYVSDYQFLNDISDSDTDFINDQLIVKDTDADLAKEGLGDIDVSFSNASGTSDADGSGSVGNSQSVDEEVKELVKNGTLRQAYETKIKGKNNSGIKLPNCYRDVNNKLYTVRNGKLIRLDGVSAIFANGRCRYNEKMCWTKDVAGTEVDPSSLKGSDTKTDKGAKTEETETLEQEAERLSSENPHLLGERFCKDISGYTNDDDFKRMKAYIAQVNEDNVEEFLKGYYDTYGGLDNGFFEQIASERGNTRLSNGEVVKVIKAIIDKYDGTSLSDEKEKALQKVKSIYEDYRNKPANSRFSNESGSWWFRLWGADVLDTLDDAVETLIKSES